MAAPSLWESQFMLPAGIQQPHMTALKNGTFLVLGLSGTYPDRTPKGWIYNADGSIKEERVLDVPPYGRWTHPGEIDNSATIPVAAELPDGRIAIMWTLDTRVLNGFCVPFVGVYSADLMPLGLPTHLAGIHASGEFPDGRYRTDAILSLGNGDLAITYHKLHQNGGAVEEAFVRVLKADGTLSAPLSLGQAAVQDFGTSITDMAALSNGNVAIVTHENPSSLKGCVLTPSGPGGPALSTPFTIATSDAPEKRDVKVTSLQGGGFVVTWTETGGPFLRYNSFLKVFDAQGVAVSGEVPVPNITHPELLMASGSDVLALPDGGFAVAYQKSTKSIAGVEGFEVYLALFNGNGARASEDIRVSDVATTKSITLEELHLMADGRILVRHSQGIQIVDPRGKALSLTGTIRDDQYIGTAFKDTMDGSGGDDSLVGAEGDDLLKGGEGSDTLFGGAGADGLNGGGGVDYVSFAGATAGVTASLAGGTGGEAAGDVYTEVEGLIGSSFDDVLAGNGAAILSGRGGNDTYHVRAGDILAEAGMEGRDTVIAAASYGLAQGAEVEVLRLAGLSSKKSASLTGSDTANEILGHAGANTLRGLGGNDVLKASAGHDILKGDAGADTLHGGAGNDRLYGGSGQEHDVFVFDTKPSTSSNVDRIHDFDPRYDSIWLENKIFANLGKGTPAGVKFKVDMFVKGRAARDKEDRVVYDSKTGALYFDQDGTGAKAQVKIGTLSKSLKLTHHDFFVI